MLKKLTFKDNEYEKQLITQRVFFAKLIIILLLLLLISRIFYLTVIRHDHFTTLSKSNWLKIAPIPPIRGLIYSRDELVLAENKSSFSLEMIPEQITDIDELLTKLQQLIKIEDSNIAKLKKQFKQKKQLKRRFESISLRSNLDLEEVALFSVNRHYFPGVDVVARLKRYYPFGKEFAHSIGYVAHIDENNTEQINDPNYSGTIHIGKLGIEKYYESLLHGQVGYQQVEVNAYGRTIRVLERAAPVSGQDIYLTIDTSLQSLAVELLQNERGAIVAMDPNNGDILAFVSAPDYDPNKFVNGIDNRSYQALLSSPDKPLINRVISGKYPPGSTLKPFFGFIGLEEDVIVSEDKIWCRGWFSLPRHQHRYRDWKKGGHGDVGLHQAIMQSCDVFFYRLANALGIDRIVNGLAQFGFGKLTDIDVSGETNAALPSRTWKKSNFGQAWYSGDTLSVGIGQGYMLSTPLQLVRAVATLANRGKVMQPRFVARMRDPLTDTQTHLPSSIVSEISANDNTHWNKIIAAMEGVVHDVGGTAWRSGLNAQYRFAGKTGTAQVIGIAQDEEYKKEEIAKEFQDHALFIAFAPVDLPQIAIAVIVENGGSGSKTAAPIARKLLDHFMNQ